MRNIFTIFKRDVRNISTNWVAAILIGGLIFLPSLYAWLNIYASSDPYGRTDKLPVAVVNEDVGADVKDEHINTGKEIVSTLKENPSMEWHFVSRKKALDGVEYGDYFAVMVLPDNLSEQLASVVSGNPQKAEIDYYVNEKLNSIAPKITEKGATVIVDKVSSQFVSTVNGVIFDMMNRLGLELEADLPDVQKFENYVFDAEKSLPEIYNLLNRGLDDATDAQAIIHQAQGKLPEAKQITDDGLGQINRTVSYLNEAEQKLNEMSPKIKADLKKVSDISNEANDFLKQLQGVQLDFTELDKAKKALDDRVTTSIERVDGVQQDLTRLQELVQQIPRPDEKPSPGTEENPDNGENAEQRPTPSLPTPDLSGRLNDAITKTEDLKNLLIEAQTNARTVNAVVQGKAEELDQAVDDLQKIAGNTSVELDRFMKEYVNTIEPTVLKEISTAKGTLGQAKGLLIEIQSTLPKVQTILGNSDRELTEGKGTIEKAVAEYPYVSEKVNQLADKIRSIQGETDINEIIKLLQNDPNAEKSFFEEPIQLKENRLFSIENYGTGMTPFYTVLSLWVGCLLLISLLSTDVHGDEFTRRQVYFGRLLTFGLIGLLQTFIVVGGDLLLLDVHIREPLWFIVFGVIISVVFMSIVYTLVSVFGDVGKAMAIVMLVLQIAGSGGTYPVVLLPDFFGAINPFLPFTYAIDVMREAVGGIVWERVAKDLTFLAVCSAAFILFGALLKERINKGTDKLLKKSKEAGIFH
ncbi:YhgE/Pip domain-containing protein [Sporosarcina aquimarina]|uniref:YhgE/Pip domain-containing protein n=1 Tax=Sporosarcina aquimarina TaxID=114975 RepID=A0ABU4FXQ6_9BACL|nr:YhgE/Pip domain-containing protein [Sporosarcina aquimarina]MDW0109509.1 YhgE/Pip domain-containing protein [Sporosarcina aquimarina]